MAQGYLGGQPSPRIPIASALSRPS